MNITVKDGRPVRLSVKPIGRGGEGVVHSVQQGAGSGSRVAKLYKPEKRTDKLEEKIDFLIKYPPATTDSSGRAYLIWPTATLYEDGDFAGLVMPRAEGVELETLCLGKLDSSLGATWQRFAHGTAEARRFRLSICRNLCHAVAALQRKKCYVLGDMKPVNVFVNEQGMVSIIDLDSVQVTERGHLLYSGKLCTPEYTPPEVLRQNKIRQLSWDIFPSQPYCTAYCSAFTHLREALLTQLLRMLLVPFRLAYILMDKNARSSKLFRHPTKGYMTTPPWWATFLDAALKMDSFSQTCDLQQKDGLRP